VSFWHHSKLQRIWVFASLLHGRRSTEVSHICTMFGHLLGWYTIYIHFRSYCPVTEFCHVQNSLCVQILHCPILAALLHGTRAVCVSRTSAFSRGHHLYLAGRPSHWESAHILVHYVFGFNSGRKTSPSSSLTQSQLGPQCRARITSIYLSTTKFFKIIIMKRELTNVFRTKQR